MEKPMRLVPHITAAIVICATVATAQIPAFFALTLNGTNGTSQVFASTDRQFMPERIVYAGATPTNGTLLVERVSGTVIEVIAQGTVATNGAGVIAATNGVVVFAGDTLHVNRGGGGTVTSAVIQAHGQLYRRFP